MTVDAIALGIKAGNERSANVALLGSASTLMDFTVEEWHEAIRASVKPKTIDVNLKAFTLGCQAVAME